MSIFCCFSSLDGKNKKNKEEKDNKIMQVKLQHIGKPVDKDDQKSKSKSKSKATFSVDVPFSISKTLTCNVKVVNDESPTKSQEQEEVAHEGDDEHQINANPQFDLQGSTDDILIQEQDDHENTCLDVNINNDGHLSDPGASKKPTLASPKLKRSCSNIETKRVALKDKVALCESYEDLQKLANGCMSPVSVISHCSADKVILRKCSSSQILPSKSRRLWWKLFLWSHRNLHEPVKGIQNKLLMINQHGGYSSDTEPNQRLKKSKSKSRLEDVKVGENHKWDAFHQGSGFFPQNQWMAFSAGSPSLSPLTRVDEWVQEIPTEPGFAIGNEEENEITFPPSPDDGKPQVRNTDLPEEIAYANRVIQSLNSSSTVAYISGIGLKVIPSISAFLTLRSVNLSGNSIVQITPGSLPKGLHILDLSRNKISVIEGLRELTRLRILDLSYNWISRIGQGLSNCTLIKELYLAGSNVEGLHRLLKLIILNLSFNKITTTKALGQLVANFNFLQALNLLGNPIQSNINDDQMRKTLCCLLPKLAYLNKQPVNPQKAREVAKEAVTKAALGSGSLSGRRKSAKRVGSSGLGGSSSFSKHRGSVGGQKGSGRHGVKSRAHHRSV